MQLPDKSFGWSDGREMPFEAKALCVLTTLALDLPVGMGHVLWLGNKPYVTAAGARHIALASKDFHFVGDRVERPMNDAEKEMAGIEEGDRHCVIEQRIEVNGREYMARGFGIADKKEIANNRVWATNKKNIFQNLRTRAERDLLFRNVPLQGVEPMPDEPNEIQTFNSAPFIDIYPPKQLGEPKVEADENRKEAIKKLMGAYAKLEGQLQSAEDILGQSCPDICAGSTESIWDALDALEEPIKRIELEKAGRVQGEQPIDFIDPKEALERL